MSWTRKIHKIRINQKTQLIFIEILINYPLTKFYIYNKNWIHVQVWYKLVSLSTRSIFVYYLFDSLVWSSAFILTLLKSVENGSGLEIFFGFLTLYWLMFCLSWFTSNTRDYTRAEELGFWIQHKVMFNWVLSDYSVKLS